MANASQKNVLARSNEERQQSATSKNGLIRRLMRGREARIRFVHSHISKSIAFQIQALRGKEGWSQPKLADKLGTNQNAVYRLENPNYGKPTITTLKKVAAAFDVALVVRFVPFSQLVDWLSETPRIDLGLNPDALAVPSFDDEVRLGNFNEHAVVVPPKEAHVEPKESNLGKHLNIDDDSGKYKHTLEMDQKLAPIPMISGGNVPYAEIGSSPR